MKALFIVPYPVDSAPSQRLKFEQYFDYLRASGVEVEVSPFVTQKFRKILYEKGSYGKKVVYTLEGYLRRLGDLFKAASADVVYIHLEAAPFGPPIFEYIFYRMKKPIIYDIDDVVYLPHASEANRFTQFLKSPSKIPAIIRMSSHVIVVTQYLKQFARTFNKNVTQIPSTINTDKYFVKSRDAGRRVCVGWTGSHSTSKYLSLLEHVLRRISGENDVRIKAIGDRNFKIDGLNIEAEDWTLETEVEDIQDIDIGLYPLPRNEWVMGKGGLKALQYMGMGIPVVCTRIGEALKFIEDGVNGFLADSEDEWVEKISKLIKDPQLRASIGLAGRRTVEEKYSIKVNAPRYLEIIKEIADRNS